MSPAGLPGREPGARSLRPHSLTTWSLAALAGGLILGLLGHASGHPGFPAFGDAIRPLGDLWVAALQMTVLPLIVTYTLAAVVGAGGGRAVGALTGRAVLLFLAMLVAVGLITIAVASIAVRSYRVDGGLLEALTRGATVPEAASQAAAAAPASFSSWLSGLLPRNLLESAAKGEVLPLLFFAAFLGLAITRLPDDRREALDRPIQALAAAMLLCVRWILALTPVGVFVFTFRFALGAGGRAAGVLGAWVILVSGLLLLCTALLYPFTALFGRTTLRAFARAVAPAQLVAVTTRSSIASLPALIEGARDRLRLPDPATAFVLPLSVSIFKVNRTISSTAKLIFLAHIYGIPLSATTLATFLVTVTILSFSTAGLPSGGTTFKTLPAYLAAGLPVEGLVILEAVETVPDIFKTLLNVTGDMSAATVLSRSAGTVRDETAAPAEAPPVPETV
jgi:Na+/H+-dicarboxylate symporter